MFSPSEYNAVFVEAKKKSPLKAVDDIVDKAMELMEFDGLITAVFMKLSERL